jgi:hypothetical protein
LNEVNVVSGTLAQNPLELACARHRSVLRPRASRKGQPMPSPCRISQSSFQRSIGHRLAGGC